AQPTRAGPAHAGRAGSARPAAHAQPRAASGRAGRAGPRALADRAGPGRARRPEHGPEGARDSGRRVAVPVQLGVQLMSADAPLDPRMEAFIARADDAGCLNLSEFCELTRELEMSDQEVQGVQEAVAAGGVEL